MSKVTGISSSNNSYQNTMQSNWKQLKQDLQDMTAAIQSNDLAGAQQAFSTLQQYMQGINQAKGSQKSNQNNTLRIDFDNLATALKSGDMSGVQKTFTSLQQDMQKVQLGHKHRHHHKTDNATTANNPNELAKGDGTTANSATINVKA